MSYERAINAGLDPVEEMRKAMAAAKRREADAKERASAAAFEAAFPDVPFAEVESTFTGLRDARRHYVHPASGRTFAISIMEWDTTGWEETTGKIPPNPLDILRRAREAGH